MGYLKMELYPFHFTIFLYEFVRHCMRHKVAGVSIRFDGSVDEIAIFRRFSRVSKDFYDLKRGVDSIAE